jgi:hypothetical protein
MASHGYCVVHDSLLESQVDLGMPYKCCSFEPLMPTGGVDVLARMVLDTHAKSGKVGASSLYPYSGSRGVSMLACTICDEM